MSTPIEFERKFLVRADAVQSLFATAERVDDIEQAYFMQDDVRCVRVRQRGADWLLTFKKATGDVGQSFEAERLIEESFAKEILPLCQLRVSKRRHYVRLGEFTWEVDEFLDHNKGLVMAEVELIDHEQSARLTAALPDWVGREVTGDPRYFNTYLAGNVVPTL
jgi:adenylate cyclase